MGQKKSAPIFGNILIIGLFLTALLIICAGLFMAYAAVNTASAGQLNGKDEKTAIEIELLNKLIKIKLTTGIVGIVVLALGVAVLLALVVKVPVRQILGYKEPPKGGFGLALDFMTPLLSPDVERIPILMWWFIQKKGIAVRVDESE